MATVIYDKFHIMGYVNAAVDETRRAEFFRLGGDRRAALKGKRWLLLTRYKHLSTPKRTELNALSINRKIFEAYYLKESDPGPTATNAPRSRSSSSGRKRSAGNAYPPSRNL